MHSDDDKIENRSGNTADGQTGGWTTADSPEGGWAPPAAAPDPWAPPVADTWAPPAAPDESPQTAPAPQGWPPNQGWNAGQGWPPAPPSPAWPPAPPSPAWPPAPPSQGWPPAPPTHGWPPVPPQWNGPAGTDLPLPHRPTRLPQLLIVVAACMIAFSGGLVVDHSAFGSNPPATAAGSQSTGVTASGSPESNALYSELAQVIRQNFVGRSTVTDQQLLYGALKGMVDSLGDTGHSVFLTPQEYQDFQNSLNATVAGIGVLISASTGVIVVNRVLPGSPAEAAGVKAGDQITYVDGASTTGMTIDELGSKVRGPAGTKVTVTVVRSGTTTPIDFTITRAQVSVPLVSWGMVPGTHIADVSLIEFSTGASNQLQTAIDQATNAGATSLVLDLRGNPGGYASEATSVASEFLTDGVVYIEQDASGHNTSMRVDTTQRHTNIPLVVLVDHDSASSSEIVAGALQDSGRAKIVGVSTFGTGTVLQKFQLSDGSVIFLGTAYWLTPSGHKIFGVGIKPDEVVTMAPGAIPVDPSALGSMTTAQLNSAGDTDLLAAIKDLSK